MQRVRTIAVPARLLRLAAIGMLVAVPPVRADSGTAVAQARTVTVPLQAYARVVPVAVVRLKSAHAGNVVGLKTLPGETVNAGAVLGHLQGPAVEAALARRQSEVASAQGELAAARKTLALEQEKQAAHLSTLKEVYQAEAALASAQARLDNAHSQIAALQSSLTLRAPREGTILSIEASAGELVGPGQTLLTLQPAGSLWLKADFFGGEAEEVRVGMIGRFAPADGAAAIPVKVRTIIGTTQPDGGMAVGLASTLPAPGWHSGEAGTVTLQGAKRTLVEVPTRALILDQGQWWVLVHTSQGNRPRAVVPGPGGGGSTLIERGLEPGTEILVENAYQEFHREFSQHFQAPD